LFCPKTVKANTLTQFQTLAFDPGGKSGWAYVHFYLDPNYNKPVCDFSLGTFREPEHHRDFRNAIEYYQQKGYRGPLNVISESFEFRKAPDSAKRREGLELVSREYIGICKLVCGDCGVQFTQQSPGILAGPLVTNDHLAALGLLPPPPLFDNKDQIAATRHLLYYLLRTPAKSYLLNAYKEFGLAS